jgi:hypothetical protein
MYSVTVKIDGIESRRRSAGLMHIIIGFFMIAKAATYFEYLGYGNFLPVSPVLLVAGISLFYGLFRRKLDLFAKYNYWLRLLQVTAFTYLGLMLVRFANTVDYASVFVFAILSIILLFSERRIFQETTIFFDEAGVLIPGYYRNHLVKWTDLTEVNIREDIVNFFNV